jgi:hypothetical protein
MNHPFHSIHVALPRALMDGITDEAGAHRIDNFRYVPGEGSAIRSFNR